MANEKDGENHKPEENEKPESPLSCVESFLGVFKNLFGCIKNAEEAVANGPSGLTQQLPQSVQAPQQVSLQFDVLGRRKIGKMLC
jgi:hypothetical protein